MANFSFFYRFFLYILEGESKENVTLPFSCSLSKAANAGITPLTPSLHVHAPISRAAPPEGIREAPLPWETLAPRQKYQNNDVERKLPFHHFLPFY